MQHILRHISTNWNPDTLQAKFIYEYWGDIYETDYFTCIDENTLVNGWAEFFYAFLTDNEGINTIPDEDLQSVKFEKWGEPSRVKIEFDGLDIYQDIIIGDEFSFFYMYNRKKYVSELYPADILQKDLTGTYYFSDLDKMIVEDSFNEYYAMFKDAILFFDKS